MKLRNTVILVAAVAMAAMIQTAQASITLRDLVSSGGSITIDDKTFSDFGYTPGGAIIFDPSVITVSAYILNGVDYLDFAGPIAVHGGLGDLKLSYTVTATAGAIVMIDQLYTPNAQSVDGNQIIIGETARDIAGNTAISTLTLNPGDFTDPPTEVGDNLVVNPSASQLLIVKDILIYAAPGQLVGLSDVEQSFHQIPEPTTMLAGALLLLPLGASTLRILRRNRIG